MTELFLKTLGMSATAALTAAAVMVLRIILKPAPKVFSYVLWAAVFIRLLCPISLPLPTAKASPITPVIIHTEKYSYEKILTAPFSFRRDRLPCRNINIHKRKNSRIQIIRNNSANFFPDMALRSYHNDKDMGGAYEGAVYIYSKE